MKTLALTLIAALGIALGAVTSAHAERWPADSWERLDRECFEPTTASRALLATLLQETQRRSTAKRVPSSEPALIAHEVMINSSRVKLSGVASNEQAIARIEDHLRGAKPSAVSRGCSLPPAGMLG